MVYGIEDNEPYEFRLPQEIRPLHYELLIELDWLQQKFNGTVAILFKVLAPINYIALHACGLNIHTETLHRVDFRLNRRVFEEFHSFNFKKFDYWITSFQEKLKEGEYQIRLRFNAKFEEQEIGLFATKPFVASNGNEQIVVGTRFTPAFARLVFPCFDEPEMKATFELKIMHADEPGFMAISTTNIEKIQQLTNKTLLQFALTPAMSPHMLSFAVTNFDFNTQIMYTSKKSFEMRIFARHDKIHMTKYALSVASFMIEYLTDYFDYAYPLQKLDLVAIPRLSVGLAEHWGLFYFDESLLLYDAGLNTSANKQRIAMLLAHAMTRMWIGGLVTLLWWDQLWISKGLASLMEYKCVHELQPDWGMMDQFLIMELYPVMAIDAAETHPLLKIIDEASEIALAFDKLSVMKGAAIVRMLENLVGADYLQHEISKYIKKYAYGNAEVEDFLNVLQAGEIDVPLVKFMKSFMEQKGFPLVKVSRNSDYNSFRLTQQRFLADPEDYNQKLRSSKIFFNWTIPITYMTSVDLGVKRTVFYRHEQEHLLTLPDDEHIKWIKVNKDNIGYYRVNYSNELWHELTVAVIENPTQFSISDRAQLLSDSYACANASLLPLSVPLELTYYLSQETAFVPWYVAINEVQTIAKLLDETNLHNEFLDFGQTLVQKLYRKMSWTGELSHLENLLRVTIFDAACSFCLQEALDAANELFSAWLLDENFGILPDLKGIVLIYGMQQVGNAKIWQIVFDRFVMAQNPVERRRLLHSLAAIPDHRILSDLLHLIKQTPGISDEEIFKCFHFVSINVHGRDVLWNFVRKSWLDLVERFGKKNYNLSQVIPTITRNFTTHKRLDELQDFFDEIRGKGISTAARRAAIDKIEYNIYWLSFHESAVRLWLRAQIFTDSFHTAKGFLTSSQTSWTVDV